MLTIIYSSLQNFREIIFFSVIFSVFSILFSFPKNIRNTKIFSFSVLFVSVSVRNFSEFFSLLVIPVFFNYFMKHYLKPVYILRIKSTKSSKWCDFLCPKTFNFPVVLKYRNLFFQKLRKRFETSGKLKKKFKYDITIYCRTR